MLLVSDSRDRAAPTSAVGEPAGTKGGGGSAGVEEVEHEWVMSRVIAAAAVRPG